MQVKGIKKGQSIELLEMLDIPDGSTVYLEIVPERSPTQWWQMLTDIRAEIEATGEGLIEDSFLVGLRDRQPGRDVEL